MFLGSTSSRISGASCWRRQRLRKAMATARLASCWPMMKRSSSETISRGVKEEFIGPIWGVWRCPSNGRQTFDCDVLICVDADVGGDLHGAARDLLGREIQCQ